MTVSVESRPVIIYADDLIPENQYASPLLFLDTVLSTCSDINNAIERHDLNLGHLTLEEHAICKRYVQNRSAGRGHLFDTPKDEEVYRLGVALLEIADAEIYAFLMKRANTIIMRQSNTIKENTQ